MHTVPPPADRYRKLGISHFVLSDARYKQEIIRIGDQPLPRQRESAPHEPAA